jgi:hypothetical protein
MFALLLQEVENGQPYEAKTNMYGLGCLAYEMASLEWVKKRRCPTRVAVEDLTPFADDAGSYADDAGSYEL